MSTHTIVVYDYVCIVHQIRVLSVVKNGKNVAAINGREDWVMESLLLPKKLA